MSDPFIRIREIAQPLRNAPCDSNTIVARNRSIGQIKSLIQGQIHSGSLTPRQRETAENIDVHATPDRGNPMASICGRGSTAFDLIMREIERYDEILRTGQDPDMRQSSRGPVPRQNVEEPGIASQAGSILSYMFTTPLVKMGLMSKENEEVYATAAGSAAQDVASGDPLRAAREGGYTEDPLKLLTDAEYATTGNEPTPGDCSALDIRCHWKEHKLKVILGTIGIIAGVLFIYSFASGLGRGIVS